MLLLQAANYGIREIYSWEGVEVFPPSAGHNVEPNLFDWCTHAITHLEYTGYTIGMARLFKRPCFQIVHNDSPYDPVLTSPIPLGIIYNSQWIADKLRYKHRSMVMTPPVDYRYYDQGIADPYDNEYITLINCNDNKGGKQFSKIAEAMPDRKFLAVRGSYEEQFIADLPNLHIMDNTSDIRPIYKMTRILLMPSEYESFGMCASEAMCNGIPVICTRTPGLLENTAGKMLYCKQRMGEETLAFMKERDPALYAELMAENMNISQWLKHIKTLDNRKKYQAFSKAGRERAKELDPLAGYEKLEQFLYGTSS